LRVYSLSLDRLSYRKSVTKSRAWRAVGRPSAPPAALSGNCWRWISHDPAGFVARDANLNRYVRNNPTSSNDRDGLWAPGDKIKAKIAMIKQQMAMWKQQKLIAQQQKKQADKAALRMKGFELLFGKQQPTPATPSTGQPQQSDPGPQGPDPQPLYEFKMKKWEIGIQ